MNDWRTYDGVAETYERVNGPRLVDPARDLVALSGAASGGRILDVGTGTGIAAGSAQEVVGAKGLAVGIDTSLGMLKVAASTRPSVRLAAASAIDLPFRNGTFDVVLASFVISHFKSYHTALSDMIRVLRYGGRLAVSAWADDSDDLDELTRTWLELVQGVVGDEMLGDVHAQAVPWSDRMANRGALEEALIEAGLRHVRAELHEYHFVYRLQEYVEGLGTWSTGRFVRSMLDEASWEDFRRRALGVFRERFADPVNDYRRIWLAVGTKA